MFRFFVSSYRETEKQGPLLLIFFCAGLLLLSIGLYWGRQNINFLDRAIKAGGEVIRLDRQGGYYYPIVKYQDSSGISRTLYGSTGSRPPTYFEGERVNVLYDPNDDQFPLNAKIDSFMQLWFGPICLSGLGSVFIIVQLCIWRSVILYNRKRKNKRPRKASIDAVL